jgi:molecular chaperone DnaK
MDYIIDRPLLEHLAKDLLTRMKAACQIAITEAQRKDANFSVRDLNDVVLVGGGTRMPAVQHMAHQVFGQEAKTDIDPEIAVALGAAIRAAVIEGRKSDLTVQDILSFSVAIEVYDKVEGVASVIIPRGTPYPSEKETAFALTNREAGQSVLPIRIVTGDHDRAVLCEMLHAVDVDIEPGDPRTARVPLTIGVNERGQPYGRVAEIEWGTS